MTNLTRLAPAVLFLFAAPLWAQSPVEVRSLSGTIDLAMAILPEGSFVMGNTGATPGEGLELPTHEVRVAPFAVGVYEVTQAQFEAVMGYNPSHNRGPTLPVERVSWYDAVRFCNTLSRLDGLTPAYALDPFDGYTRDPSANGYRLPTEAEWAYAAKAGTTSDTYAGDLSGTDLRDDVLDEIAWYDDGTGRPSTRPVGLKAPNAFGLFDAIGNVFEWVDGPLEPYPGGQLDPATPGVAKAPALKVLRGGAMDTAKRFARAAYRYRLHASYTSHNVGFRIVRSIDVSDEEE